MSAWQIIATYTKVRDGGTSDQPKPVYAFAVKSVGLENATSPTVPPCISFPWTEWKAGDDGTMGRWFRSVSSTGQDVRLVRPSPASGDWGKITADLEKAFKEFEDRFTPNEPQKLFAPINSTANTEVADKTWSGVIGSLSKSDQLVARGLGLVAWIVTSEDWDQPLVPELTDFRWPPEPLPETKPAVDSSEPRVRNYIYKSTLPDAHTIKLVIQLGNGATIWKHPDFGITDGLIGKAIGPIDADSASNWRADLPGRLAEFIDPLTWWHAIARQSSQPIAAKTDAMKEALDLFLVRVDPGLRSAPAFLPLSLPRGNGAGDWHGTLAFELLSDIWKDNEGLASFLSTASSVFSDQIKDSTFRDWRRVFALRDIFLHHRWESSFLDRYQDAISRLTASLPASHEKDVYGQAIILIHGAYNELINRFNELDETDFFAAICAIRTAAENQSVLFRQFIAQWDLLIGKGGSTLLREQLQRRTGSETMSAFTDRLDAKLKTFERPLALRYLDGVAGEVWPVTAAKVNSGSAQPTDPLNLVADALKVALGSFFALLPTHFGFQWQATVGFESKLKEALANDTFGYLPIAADALIRNRPGLPLYSLGETFAPESDPFDPAVTAPPPLTLDSPAAIAGFSDHFSGVLLVVRRVKDPGHETRWRCVTLGSLVLKSLGQAPVTPGLNEQLLSGLHLTPIPVNEAMRIAESQVDYTDQFIGPDESSSLGKIKGESFDPQKELVPGLRLIVRESASLPEDWQLPGRKYQPQTEYEFAFIPVHHSGALPPEFSKSGRSDDIGMFTDDLGLPANAPVTVIRNYVRRVKVGGVRFALAQAGSRADTDSPQLPPVPRGVKPLARELPAAGKPKSDTPLLLLSPELSAWEVQILPPTTSIENWKILARSVLPDADLVRTGAAFHTLQPVKSSETSNAVTDEEDLITNPLDDPAVEAVLISVRQKFSLEKGMIDQEVGRELLWKPPFAEAAPPPGTTATADVQAWLQRTFGQITIKRSPPAAAPTLKKTDSSCTLELPPGSICELIFRPCIGRDMLRRFAVPQSPLVPWFDDPLVEGYHPTHGDTRLLVEATPRVRRESGTTSKEGWLGQFLPSAADVLRSLRLRAALDLATKEPVQRGRLEAVLVPQGLSDTTSSSNGRWAMISAVLLRLQPWRWNGIPHRAEILARVAGFSAIPPAAEATVLTTDLKIEEILAFGERELDDSIPRLTSVSIVAPRPKEQTDDRDQTWSRIRDNNFAGDDGATALALRHEKSEEEHALFQETGPLENFPRYYRAHITVYSRYWAPPQNGRPVGGLIGFRDAQVEGFIEENDISTQFRRWLIPGHSSTALPLPRVKMIVPALHGLSREGEKGSRRPGFFAFVQDELVSPFQRLSARVVDVRGRFGKSYESSQEISLFEAAPDAAQSLRTIMDDPAALEALRTPMRGSPIGLTFEREAGSPLFPSVSYYFEFGGDAQGLIAQVFERANEFGLIDFFAKIAVRWETSPEEVMVDTPAEFLTGPETMPTQLRLLAGFTHVRADDSPEPVAINDITFSLRRQKLEFYPHGNGAARTVTPYDFPEAGDAKVPPSFEPRLLFIACHAATRGLADAVRVGGIYAIDQSGVAQKIEGLSAESVDPGDITTKNEQDIRQSTPTFGYFVLCHVTRKTPLWPPRNAAGFLELFFPIGSAESDPSNPPLVQDAQGMMVRCSSAVFAEISNL